MANLYLARVHVTLKAGVLDPQGEAVKQGLLALGYKGVQEVRVGKYLEVRLEALDELQAAQQVEEMCRRLLANPVIENYTFEVTAP
ncbi:MAG: phosphoribosylformylglycinamidine synthase subunit PurS [Moorellaceae bacterium]